MPVLFGIPVLYEEATRIFGVRGIDEKGLSNHLKQFGIGLFYNDKAQYIFGYKIEGIGGGAGYDGKFLSYYQFAAKIFELAHRFSLAMKHLNADMSEVALYPTESDCYTVNYPEPFIIEGYATQK